MTDLPDGIRPAERPLSGSEVADLKARFLDEAATGQMRRLLTDLPDPSIRTTASIFDGGQQPVRCPRCHTLTVLDEHGRLDRHTVIPGLDGQCPMVGWTPAAVREHIAVEALLADAWRAIRYARAEAAQTGRTDRDLRCEISQTAMRALCRHPAIHAASLPDGVQATMHGVPVVEVPDVALPDGGWRIVRVLAEGAVPQL